MFGKASRVAWLVTWICTASVLSILTAHAQPISPAVLPAGEEWWPRASLANVASQAAQTAPEAAHEAAGATTWNKYGGNPVLAPGPAGSFDSVGPVPSSVLYKDGLYWMWYSATRQIGGAYEIGLATSRDGLTWSKYEGNPVVKVGARDAWDDGTVIAPSVIFYDGLFRMWYRGIHGYPPGRQESIGLATSPDGIHWTKYAANPVLTAGPAVWESKGLMSASVQVAAGVYKMWYVGQGGDAATARIGYATSTNGVDWTKYDGNPVVDVGPQGSWEDYRVLYPSVLFHDGMYEMWYTGSTLPLSNQVGHALSADGVEWTKSSLNPVLKPDGYASWEQSSAMMGAVLLQSGVYKMWYAGGSMQPEQRTGYATTGLVAMAGLDFVIGKNSYQFSNSDQRWGKYPGTAGDFGTAELITVFGAENVCTFSRGSCVPKAAANEWAGWINKVMNRGRCDGMASTSLRLFKGLDSPEGLQLGASTTHDLELSSARRYIAMYYAKRATNPVQSYADEISSKPPSEILDHLNAVFAGRGADPVVMFFFQKTTGGYVGHTVTPYGVQALGGGIYRVKVYDNNNTEDAYRYLEINREAETWSYDFSPTERWSGNADTATLGIVPISLYAEPPICPWCSSARAGRITADAGNQADKGQVWMIGDGHLQITDGDGNRLGYAGGAIVEEIPGASANFMPTGSVVAQEPIYTLPLTQTYTIRVLGSPAGAVRIQANEPISVMQFGPEYAAGVDGITPASPALDSLEIAPDGRQIRYQAGGSNQVALTVARDGAQESIQFTVGGADIAAGEVMTLSVDETSKVLQLASSGTDGTYSLDVLRTGAEGEDTFSVPDISIAAGDTQYIDYGQWADGKIPLRVDHGSDGHIDETLTLGAQGSDLYLPHVRR